MFFDPAFNEEGDAMTAQYLSGIYFVIGLLYIALAAVYIFTK